MDFSSLSAHGRSTTSTAWVTNPMRRLAWRLIAPYFRGAGAEFSTATDRRFEEFAAQGEARLRTVTASLSSELREMLAAELSGRMAAELPGMITSELRGILAEELSGRLATELPGMITSELRGILPSELRGMLASELRGLRGDTNAIAFRLGGLEEEAAASQQARSQYTEQLETLLARTQEHSARTRSIEQAHAQLVEWIGKVQAQVHEQNASVMSAEQMRAQLTEWVGKLHTQVQQQGADLAALRPTLEQLVGRIDAWARGTPLRAGQRAAMGETGLVIIQTAAGTRMLVRQQDHIGRIIADGQEWEPHVREAIERAAQPDGIAIDAGAYIGVHTLTMARSFATVHAFEPQRVIYQMLCGNLALNCCDNVIAHHAALYDRGGFVRLAPQERQETELPLKDDQPNYARISNAAALSFDFSVEHSGDVRAIALDDLALENVRLIKVDTQGADLRVLQGAAETIRRCRPIILFEWERDLDLQHDTTLGEFFEFFADMSYETTMLHDTTPGRQADYIARPR